MDNESNKKTTETPKKNGHGLITTALIALAVSIVTAMAVVAFYDQRYAQKIVTMDLQGYIRDQRDKAVSGEISDEELRKNIDAMEAALLAEPTNHIVLLKEVVLRNAREIKP
ncbi:MAG: hypothetical protein BM485_16115 [Desulfobulbaceae bacterium DB1]|nr:MAG: hypothetical protein BM485_16115 [Desulfobulbaceae bacterium DB1]